MLSHDIAIYERELDGTKENSYDCLYEAANRYIKTKRLEHNRERIAKQAASGMTTAPALRKPVPKGFCIDFVHNGSCSKDSCKYKHRMPDKPRGRTPNAGGKGKVHAHVQWYLLGWNHEIYDHRTGRRERQY